MVVLAATALTKRSFYSVRENNVIETILSLDPDSYYCTIDGQIISDFCQRCQEFPGDTLFQLHFRLFGGKGGFGSLLRSFRVNKSTNQLMCRDLNGRRLASIDEEQKLKKWIERAAEREKEKIAKRNAKYEKLKSGPPKHMFNDPDYIRQKETIIEKTEEAFEQGMHEEQEKKANPVVESSSDSDFDIDDLPGGLKTGRKRKAKPASTVDVKLPKFLWNYVACISCSDEEAESDSDSDENDVDPELLNEIKEYFSARDAKLGPLGTNEPCSSKIGDTVSDATNVTQQEHEETFTEIPAQEEKLTKTAAKETSLENLQEETTQETSANATLPKEPKEKKKHKESKKEAVEPQEFVEVDLTKYESATELEALGLQHLKHALLGQFNIIFLVF
ncbi:unnamed protein product [Strongylus vulgaris]|uniref:Uncharacterized protein n=1 Tax=Strongylus vulgaris TaxID=40348 RepID=A0A3P7K7N6_STRVU|nr:unnamed protein product [Strongylus vulgaris]